MEEFKISEVGVVPVKPREGFVAFASCVINKSLYLGSIAIFTSPTKPDDFRLVYPSKKLPNGKLINIFHPINKKSGELISKAIIDKFNELKSKAQK